MSSAHHKRDNRHYLSKLFRHAMISSAHQTTRLHNCHVVSNPLCYIEIHLHILGNSSAQAGALERQYFEIYGSEIYPLIGGLLINNDWLEKDTQR
jgi:hypothetical protein